MTESELKKLNRAELLAMLISITQRCDELEEELESVYGQLDSRNIEISNAGSLAEAALRINKVLEAADQAGAQYLENLQRMYPSDGSIDPEALRQMNLEAAARAGVNSEAEERATRERCQRIEQETKRRCVEMVESAKKESQAYWDEIYSRMKRYSEAMASIKEALNKK